MTNHVFDAVRDRGEVGQSIMVKLKDIDRVIPEMRGKTISCYFTAVNPPMPRDTDTTVFLHAEAAADRDNPEIVKKGAKLIFHDWLVEEVSLVTGA